MMPVIKELHKTLVKEEGEENITLYDLESSNSDEDSDVPLKAIIDDLEWEFQVNDHKSLKLKQKRGFLGNIEITDKRKSSKNVDMRNMLGFLNQNLYYDYLNITNIMKLKRLDFRDVYSIRSVDLMITRENLIERMMILITSYFWMGTELRFLKQMKLDGFEKTHDAEYWHGKALEIAVKFLPGDCPLVKHIVASYKKNHSPSSEWIPEDNEVSSDVLVIKPLNGIEIK